jgi:hypothetical protein
MHRSIRVTAKEEARHADFTLKGEDKRASHGRGNSCVIHPELVILRYYVQYACANHAYPLSQSMHNVQPY